MAVEKENRCWPGYEPVPGKEAHEQGSCRKQPAAKTTPAGKKVQAARKREVDQFQKEHPNSPRSAAQGHGAKKTKAAVKKRTAPK